MIGISALVIPVLLFWLADPKNDQSKILTLGFTLKVLIIFFMVVSFCLACRSIYLEMAIKKKYDQLLERKGKERHLWKFKILVVLMIISIIFKSSHFYF